MKWKLKKLNYIRKTWYKLWLEKEKSTSSSFTTIKIILNTSLRFLKVLLIKSFSFHKFFNTLLRNYLTVKYSKQRFNRGRSVARILKIKEHASSALSNKFSPSLNKTMVSKYFRITLAFLFIHGLCQCKLPVQLDRDFFISCLIGVHHWALKIFK